MKIEEENKADTKPDVQDEVHASPNTNQLRELGAVLGHPNEVDARRRDDASKLRDCWRSLMLRPGIQQNAG